MRGHAMSSSAPTPARSPRAENWSAAMASNPTDVSNLLVSESPSPVSAVESAASCTACPHSTDSHDALGVRFCAVTSARSLDRKCICAGEQVSGQHYSRY
ncbi:RGCVC family protein [Rhodococcus opacus]|uniref:RGCVC family protein n=1 Tax=Rhodococcus opacus TaxID=37919 RepID=UPI0027D32C32|nr:RGCVC family protein [Rhodococcus opacus]